jgi:hypothetical protein
VSTWADENAKEDDAAEMGSILRDELQNVNDDELAQGYKIGASLDVIDDDAEFELFYAVCLWKYLEQAKKTHLDGKTTLELESIFSQPVFKKQFEKISQLYNDGNLIRHLTQLAEPYPELKNFIDTTTTDTAQLIPQTEVGKDTPIPSKTAQQTDDDSETEDFREATIGKKAVELRVVIEELLNRVEGKEHEFWDEKVAYNLNDLKGIFESILTLTAYPGENTNTQRAIIDELSGDKRVSPQSAHYYKGRLWLQPFFIILGHLHNKGVWKGDQLSFVRALFSDKPYKYDEKFINACRAKISLGNTTLFKKPEDSKKLNVKWKTWFEWIDTLL